MKTMVSIKHSLLFFLVLFAQELFSQHLYETTLSSNPVLIRKYAERGPQLRAASITDTLIVPSAGLRDDFSYEGPYPDTAMWLDDFVYINRSFAKAPLSTGVATFDGLSNTGLPYDWTVTTTSSNDADYLTSKPIDLSFVPYNDTTVFLSFYYQPQGIGNGPELKDSLVVEFRAPGIASPWKHIWSKKGSSLAASDSSWTYVMIPIRDSAFLQKGFQFRFFNYATLLGNLDHWHIDYVHLNNNRYISGDTAVTDMTFVYDLPALLNDYTAMPWRHYDTTYMRSSYNPTFRNNGPALIISAYEYRIFNGGGTQTHYYDGGTENVDPFDVIGYFSTPNWTNAPIAYKIPPLSGPENYKIRCNLYVSTASDLLVQNDTIEHIQEFAYHYAYDDGTAEAALGAYTTGSNTDIAVKFTFTKPDTLRFVDIYFNPITTNASYYTFKLKVWNVGGGGAPGTQLFISSANLSPAYYGTGNNVFVRYALSSPLYLSAGTYFVGMIQNTNWFMNIGLDKNTNTQSKVFYNDNAGGGWNTSPFVGSMMIRPVFGTSADFTGVNDAPVKKEADFSIYPNPVKETLFIRSDVADLSKIIRYEIYDLYGRKMLQEQSTTASADVSSLSNGIYLIRIMTEDRSSSHKFIIAR